MSIFESFILGLVQGLTEFLPVSSSGHLILVSQILGLEKMSVGFELICHLGTLLAVIIALNKDILAVIKKPLGKPMRLIVVATIPTVIIVVAFRGFFRSAFGGEYLVYGFLITAILLLIVGFAPRKATPNKQMSYLDAVIIGTAQGIAALPGISRSGSTIAAGSLLGLDRATSARFSFLICIPIIIGSSLVELITNGVGVSIGVLPLLIGFFTSFASGFFAIKVMLKLLNKFNLDIFAIYLFILSTLMLLNQFLIHLF